MNIAKLNTASLDDKTFIIKRGTSGGTTINNQDKVVDITENGTTEVVADGGYTGLGKVTINTEVSGGGESGGEREVSYYSIPNDADVFIKRVVIGYAIYIKGTLSTGTKCIEIAGAFVMRADNVHDYAEAVAIEWDAFHSNVSGTSLTCREHFEQLVGTPIEQFSQFATPITKEEFYSLE